jgi:hypothetical protein
MISRQVGLVVSNQGHYLRTIVTGIGSSGKVSAKKFGRRVLEAKIWIHGASPTPGLGRIGHDVYSSFPEELRSHRK